MAYWRTNEQMATWADIFATELLNMVNFTTEKSPNIPGVDPQVNGEAVIRDVIIEDAEFFMSMNPERLEQEFNDQVRAAATVHDDAAMANMEYAQSLFAPGIWTGHAAEAFHKQMTNIENFVTEQQAQALLAAQAAGMMLAVSVQFRESFFSLMDMTTDVCQAAVRGQVNTGTNWKSLFVDVVAEVKNILTMKAAADLGSGAIDKLISGTKMFTDEPVPDSDAGAIIDGYIGSRNRLKKSFQDNVEAVQRWIASRRTEFADKDRAPELMKPMSPTTDVDGPAFCYSEFAYVASVPGVDDASVEWERQRYITEKSKPGGLIGRRLSGEGEP
jgi:hypothetical protein